MEIGGNGGIGAGHRHGPKCGGGTRGVAGAGDGEGEGPGAGVAFCLISIEGCDRQGGSEGRAGDQELEAAGGGGACVVGGHDLQVEGAQICRTRGAREAPSDRIKIQPGGQCTTANLPGSIKELIARICFAKCIARDDEVVGS